MKTSFSKWLIKQESLLIWIITISYIILAFVSITVGFNGSLPWLTALPTVAWAAYGVSQAFYYNKSKAENTKNGVVFEQTMTNIKKDM